MATFYVSAEDGIQHSAWTSAGTNHPTFVPWREIYTAVTNRESVGGYYFGYSGPIDLSKSNHPAFHGPATLLYGLTNSSTGWVDTTRASGGDLAEVLQANGEQFPRLDGARLVALHLTNLLDQATLVSTNNLRDWRRIIELMRAVELYPDVLSNEVWTGTYFTNSSISLAEVKAAAESVATNYSGTYGSGGSWSQAMLTLEGNYATWQRGLDYVAAMSGSYPPGLVGTVDCYVASSGPSPWWDASLTNFYGYGLSVTNWTKLATQAGAVSNIVFSYGAAVNAPDWGPDNAGRGYEPRYKLLFRGPWNP